MYELCRVRLFSVGPPGARYQDVTLDLRGVGDPVEPTGRQADLFAPDAADRVPRRPAPASVLFLENGGGKSVLLKLVFSVVLPGRRQVVGTSSTTVLDRFVLAEDVAHVACEWMHTGTGELLVTGKVSQWRGHVVSADPEKLSTAWYSFRPDAGFGLDELPFTAAGRRVTSTGFKDQLARRHRDRPAFELVWETAPGEWTRHLVDVGLDPELFRYQREMNAGEGEAADTFSFATDEAFVDFLLRAVVDPEEPRALADLVAGYATRLAERADLEREREFVDGTLTRLEPLLAAERAAAGTRDGEAAAARSAASLAAALVARSAAEDDRLAAAADALAAAVDRLRAAEAAERDLQAVAVELRRLAAVHQLEAARHVERDAAAAHDEAQRRLAAWQAVEPVLRRQIADAEAGRLRGIVAAEQERARPALLARQDAAAALAAALRGTAGEADAAAHAADELAAAADERAAAARDGELAQVTEAATRREAASQARAAVAAIDRAVTAAVVAGHLPEGADVTAEHTAAHDTARAAAAAVEAVHAELTGLRRARRTADDDRAGLRAAATAARLSADRADAAHREAAAARDALAAEPRLAELLGVADVRPDADAEAAAELLRAALGRGDRRRTELLAAQARDSRALAALGAGGLLPEPHEVQQVLAALEAAGITAYSGWRYLTTLPAARRAELLARLPHLVAGVLLNNPADAAAARAVLTEQRLLPCAAVVIGATDTLATGDADAPGVDFVVPPNPALFDEAEAGATRERLAAETAARAAELAAVEADLEADRALAARLRAWRERYPHGSVAELAAALDAATAAALAADDAVAAADTGILALDERADQLEREAPLRAAAVEAARSRAAALDAVLTQVRRRPELEERDRAAAAAVDRAVQLADRARAEAAAARRDADEARATRDRQRRVAEGCRVELAELPLDAATPELPAPADGVSLAALRAAYRGADAAYAAAAADADLHAALREAERAAAAAQADVDQLTGPVRAAAEALLRSPDAADLATRRAATEQARAGLGRDADRLRTATAEATVARRELAAFTAPPCPTDPYPTPESAERARELVDRVAADLRAAAAAGSAARDRAAAAEAAQRAAQAGADGFRHAVAGLDEAPAVEPGAVPFPGDVDDALARWRAARAAVRAAAGARAGADRDVRAAADAVAQFGQQARFSTVTSPVRHHLLGLARTELPGLAAQLQQALRPRLRSLSDDLATITRHRAGIVTRLQGMVVEALRTLRLAQRLSELPDGLSDWSGQQFLRIRFEELTDAPLHHALGEVLDRTAEERRTGRVRDQRDGMSLLLRGVRAAMPKGVRAEMLKPDAVLRTERLRVCEIRDVFSGGQQLTAAIVLYCTMASLRAHQRGAGRRAHAGVLFLDNPIGRASAGYLLELQFGVARALGVQLVYTTGLFDAGALSAFPLIIRLRNDADLRAGRRYLTVADRAAAHLAELPDPDGTGRLTATRVYRRPPDGARGSADRSTACAQPVSGGT